MLVSLLFCFLILNEKNHEESTNKLYQEKQRLFFICFSVNKVFHQYNEEFCIKTVRQEKLS